MHAAASRWQHALMIWLDGPWRAATDRGRKGWLMAAACTDDPRLQSGSLQEACDAGGKGCWPRLGDEVWNQLKAVLNFAFSKDLKQIKLYTDYCGISEQINPMQPPPTNPLVRRRVQI